MDARVIECSISIVWSLSNEGANLTPKNFNSAAIVASGSVCRYGKEAAVLACYLLYSFRYFMYGGKGVLAGAMQPLSLFRSARLVLNIMQPQSGFFERLQRQSLGNLTRLVGIVGNLPDKRSNFPEGAYLNPTYNEIFKALTDLNRLCAIRLQQHQAQQSGPTATELARQTGHGTSMIDPAVGLMAFFAMQKSSAENQYVDDDSVSGTDSPRQPAVTGDDVVTWNLDCNGEESLLLDGKSASGEEHISQSDAQGESPSGKDHSSQSYAQGESPSDEDHSSHLPVMDRAVPATAPLDAETEDENTALNLNVYWPSVDASFLERYRRLVRPAQRDKLESEVLRFVAVDASNFAAGLRDDQRSISIPTLVELLSCSNPTTRICASGYCGLQGLHAAWQHQGAIWMHPFEKRSPQEHLVDASLVGYINTVILDHLNFKPGEVTLVLVTGDGNDGINILNFIACAMTAVVHQFRVEVWCWRSRCNSRYIWLRDRLRRLEAQAGRPDGTRFEVHCFEDYPRLFSEP